MQREKKDARPIAPPYLWWIDWPRKVSNRNPWSERMSSLTSGKFGCHCLVSALNPHVNQLYEVKWWPPVLCDHHVHGNEARRAEQVWGHFIPERKLSNKSNCESNTKLCLSTVCLVIQHLDCCILHPCYSFPKIILDDTFKTTTIKATLLYVHYNLTGFCAQVILLKHSNRLFHGTQCRNESMTAKFSCVLTLHCHTCYCWKSNIW